MVLIKLVLANLPTYFLSLFIILACMEKRIEQFQRDFLRGRSKDGNGLHLVAWNKVCKPKYYGGLGINKIRTINRALLFKWLWRFRHKWDSPWQQVIACKYGVVSEWEANTPVRPYGCGCWRVIMKVAEDFKQGMKFEIGSGSRVHFWKDKWGMDRPLMLESPSLFNMVRNKDVKVADCWVSSREGGAWNIGLRRSLNNWEINDMTNLIGLVDQFHPHPNMEDSII